MHDFCFRSIDENGKMSWGVEVEPPENMDETHYDIDPRMTIWMGSGQDKQHLKAEDDLDHLYHPSVPDLLQVQMQNLDALPAADIQAESLREDANVKYNQASEEPEQDWDEVYHKARQELDRYLAPIVAGYKAGAEVRVAHSEPEEDTDALYHRDDQRSPVQMEPLRPEVRRDSEVRVHLQPEEDMDDLYHKDLPHPISYQEDTKAAAPVYMPSQRKYSEPEEDLDYLYHK